MKQLLIVALAFISVLNIYAENPSTPQDSLIFTGQIFDRETLTPLGNAVYIHRSTMYVADDDGRFHLAAIPGDTVVFHYIGYKDLLLAVQDSLTNMEYLAGIFLSPDLVHLSEVMVVPRHYDFETLVKTTPIDYSKIQIAEKNIRLSAYQGLMPNSNWDAATNQKYSIQKEIMRQDYKGMVAPDKMFSANLLTVVPLAKNLYESKDIIQIDLGGISTQETTYLITVFDAIRKEKEKNTKIIGTKKAPLK